MTGPALFDPLTIRGVEFVNRIVVSPMCMYSATTDGFPTPWHLVHLGSRAIGGVGAVVVEATAVSPEGRITDGDLGIWDDQHADALAPLADFIASTGAIPGIQLAHAGRKGGRTIPWAGYDPIPREDWGDLPAPTSAPFHEGWEHPRVMSLADITTIVDHFARAAARAVRSGYRVIELHFAHGYLVHQFLSPLVNDRTDAYGGALENRARLARDITRAVRASIPDDVALFARLSVVDWREGGLTLEESIEIARMLAQDGVDLVDCSSGAVVPGEKVPAAPGYQVEFARRIREESGVLTGAVGLIVQPAQADRIIRGLSADLVFIGRALLRDAYWARRAAVELAVENPLPLPLPYRRAVERMDRMTQW